MKMPTTILSRLGPRGTERYVWTCREPRDSEGACSRRRRRSRRRPETTAYASRLIAIVEAVPWAKRLKGASDVGGGATGELLARNVLIPFSCASIEMSRLNIAPGSVDWNPDDSVGSLARKTNITDSHNPVSISVLR